MPTVVSIISLFEEYNISPASHNEGG